MKIKLSILSILIIVAAATTAFADMGTKANRALREAVGNDGKWKVVALFGYTPLSDELISQAEAEAGTATTPRAFSALRVSQAISAQVGAQAQSNTASNVGTGTGWFKQKTGVDLEFRTIAAGNNITIESDSDNVIVGASDGVWGAIVGTLSAQIDLQSALDAKQDSLGYTPLGNELISQAEAEGGTATTAKAFSALRIGQAIAALETGQSNTASNVGTGTGWFKQKAGVDLELKGIVAGNNITIESDADNVIVGAVVGGGTPIGGIIMYSGAWDFDGTGLGTGDLAGWALCNGNNSTPNLTDRFVLAASASGELGATGGSSSYSLVVSQLPSHTHTFTTNTTGAHTHTIGLYNNGWNSSSGSGYPFAHWGGSAATSSNGDHSHSGTSASTGSGSAIDNRPAFIRLAYIRRWL